MLLGGHSKQQNYVFHYICYHYHKSHGESQKTIKLQYNPHLSLERSIFCLFFFFFFFRNKTVNIINEDR